MNILRDIAEQYRKVKLETIKKWACAYGRAERVETVQRGGKTSMGNWRLRYRGQRPCDNKDKSMGSE